MGDTKAKPEGFNVLMTNTQPNQQRGQNLPLRCPYSTHLHHYTSQCCYSYRLIHTTAFRPVLEGTIHDLLYDISLGPGPSPCVEVLLTRELKVPFAEGPELSKILQA